MKVTALKLRDERFGNQWSDAVLDRWNYDDFRADPRWRGGWISFDCCLYHAATDRVLLGITSFAADIFRAYDRRTGTFADLDYARIAAPFDGKFHRSLVQDDTGTVYAAVALLHDVDRFLEAPGGAIIRYEPAAGSLSRVAIPVPHAYIQAIALDPARGRIYAQCFAPEYLAGCELRTGQVRNYGLIGSGIGGMAQGENLVLDDRGRLWAAWQVTRAWQSSPGPDAARICRLDPEQDRIDFFRHGLPHPDGRPGTAKVEAFFNFHDGWVYASGANGSLYRIDPESGNAHYLFTPVPDRPSRLAAMTLAPDGGAYGVTGREGRCELLRFDFRNSRYELLGPVVDEQGEACWQVHDICRTSDGVLYACENDNPYRSSYLWEIRP